MKKFIWVVIISSFCVGCKDVATDAPTVTVESNEDLLELVNTLQERVKDLEQQNRTNINVGAPNFVATSKKVTPAVVSVSTVTEYKTHWGFPAEGAGMGSGVIVSDDGYIVTNYHVIKGAKNIAVDLLDKRKYKAELVGYDPTTDLALLKVAAKGLPFVAYGDSDNLAVGEWVLAVGNPLSLTSTVTSGIVSAKGRNINILEERYSIESFIQTDAVVNPGNSGGALVNVKGQLIGINTAIVTKSGRYEGYSFAVPANIVKKVVQDLIDFGQVQRGLLGVAIRDVQVSDVEAYNLPSPGGVMIEKVFDGGAASGALIEAGDIIAAVEGERIATVSALQESIGQYRPGDWVNMVVIHKGGKSEQVRVQLRDKNNSIGLAPKVVEQEVEQLGIAFRELTVNEGGKVDGFGVKILSIIKDSKADKSGMSPNFIVLSVNDKKINSLPDFYKSLKTNVSSLKLAGVYLNRSGKYYYKMEK